MTDFSDYIVFAAEAGSRRLAETDPELPAFTLALCAVRKDAYHGEICPAYQSFKLDYWGHDGLTIRERDLRLSTGPFDFSDDDADLRDRALHEAPYLMTQAAFDIYAATVRTEAYREQCADAEIPDEPVLRLCLEHLHSFLMRKKQSGKTVHLMFPSRGAQADAALDRAFQGVLAGPTKTLADFSKIAYAPVFLSPDSNVIGLQMADLAARPIALHTAFPDADNPAYELVREKVRMNKLLP